MTLEFSKIENIETLCDKDYLWFYTDCFEGTKLFVDYCFQTICKKKSLPLDIQKRFLGFANFCDWDKEQQYSILGATGNQNGYLFMQLNRNFLLGKNKWSFDELINTIAHELAHVQQKFFYCQSQLEREEEHNSETLSQVANNHTQMTEENKQIIKTSHHYIQFKNWWSDNIGNDKN